MGVPHFHHHKSSIFRLGIFHGKPSSYWGCCIYGNLHLQDLRDLRDCRPSFSRPILPHRRLGRRRRRRQPLRRGRGGRAEGHDVGSVWRLVLVGCSGKIPRNTGNNTSIMGIYRNILRIFFSQIVGLRESYVITGTLLLNAQEYRVSSKQHPETNPGNGSSSIIVIMIIIMIMIIIISQIKWLSWAGHTWICIPVSQFILWGIRDKPLWVLLQSLS